MNNLGLLMKINILNTIKYNGKLIIENTTKNNTININFSILSSAYYIS